MKKLIIFLFLLIAVFSIGCSVEGKAESDNFVDGVEHIRRNDIGSSLGLVYYWTNKETGVQYIILDGVGITPRLDSNGALYKEEVTE